MIRYIPVSLAEATARLPFSFSGGLTYYVQGSRWIVHDGVMYFLQAPLTPPANTVIRAVRNGEHLSFVYRVGRNCHMWTPAYSAFQSP